MTKMSTEIDYVKETDNFIRRFLDGEYIFTAKATELKYVYNPQPLDSLRDRVNKTMTLADCLNVTIDSYERYKTGGDWKIHYAKLCYEYIKTAWLTGSVQESSGLAKKVDECKTENIQLRKELAELSEKYLEALDKLEMFEKKFPPLKNGK